MAQVGRVPGVLFPQELSGRPWSWPGPGAAVPLCYCRGEKLPPPFVLFPVSQSSLFQENERKESTQSCSRPAVEPDFLSWSTWPPDRPLVQRHGRLLFQLGPRAGARGDAPGCSNSVRAGPGQHHPQLWWGGWLPGGPVCPQSASLWPASSSHIRIQPLGAEGSLSGLFWSIPCQTWVQSSSLAGSLLAHRYFLWLVCSGQVSALSLTGLAWLLSQSLHQPLRRSLSHLPAPSPALRDLSGEIQRNPSIFIPSRFQTLLGARWTGLRPFGKWF